MAGLSLTQPFGVGFGVQEPFKLENPGAGVNLSFVADGKGARRLTSLVLTFATSAVVAARYLKLELRGADAKAYAVAAVAATLAASQTQRYVFSTNYTSQAWNAGTDAFAPLPAVILSPGDQLVTSIDNLDAGDTLTNIRGTMERFPLDGVGLPAPWWIA